ncbi:serine/threonine-protein kinase ULK3-like [Spodoptera litura]|uniref:Serine/threonine-protein kinase ULK3 n=1 Tax=Spodoptera litura TaxID=69820 RepID=A0A9J7J135_SPOLT|nr:serine/threonine-protein kinase ULK3-like [Spodoptera litura]
MAFPKIDGYVVTEKLGTGSYSTVYKAYTKVGARTVVAIKCVDKSRVKYSGTAVDNLITEISLLKKLTHPHIVHMKNFTWDDKNIYIITEYCCGGDLSNYIHRYGRVAEKQVRYFLQQLASALKFLREKGVVHMDLKPHNLLLHKGSDGKYILKVADFGFASYMTDAVQRSVRGSPLYMAPEMLAGQYDARVDLWSVGVIMYECLFGRAPYSSVSMKELIDKIQKQAPIELPRNASISPGCRKLLFGLLQHDPDKRITYEDFFNDEYLDLEHMPTKENYEKAVNIIKRAIELDSAGDYSGAFEGYKQSLVYLVPCVSCEPDTLRRAALAGKLSRYMQRAEEIKLYLSTGRWYRPPKDTQTPSINYYEAVTADTPIECKCTGVCSCPSSGINGKVAEMRISEKVTELGITEEPAGSAGSNMAPQVQGSPSKPRFGFKKLFSRQPPFLETKDSSMTDEKADDKLKQCTAADQEGCRIT